MANFASLALACLFMATAVFCGFSSEPSYTGKTRIKLGEPFQILCRIPLSDPLRLQWTLNDQIIGPILYRGLAEDLEDIPWDVMNKSNNEKAEFIVEDAFRENGEGQHILSRLIVPEAKYEHTGLYRCNGLFRKGHTIVVGSRNEEHDAAHVIEIRHHHATIIDCNATQQQEAQIEWYKNGDRLEIPEEGRISVLANHSLKIEKPIAHDAGTYRCKLPGAEFDSNSREVVLKVPIKAKIEQGASLNVVEGEKLRLSCNVTGNPLPRIQWYKNNKTLPDAEDLQGRVTFEPMNEVENAILFIAEAVMEDYGVYTCQAISDEVYESDNITVRVKDKLAALWPFLGICAEVAILCTIIFIYERKRSKAELEDDADNTVEQKNAVDGVKSSEVRHRNK